VKSGNGIVELSLC